MRAPHAPLRPTYVKEHRDERLVFGSLDLEQLEREVRGVARVLPPGLGGSRRLAAPDAVVAAHPLARLRADVVQVLHVDVVERVENLVVVVVADAALVAERARGDVLPHERRLVHVVDEHGLHVRRRVLLGAERVGEQRAHRAALGARRCVASVPVSGNLK
jgi:hypothetical protein